MREFSKAEQVIINKILNVREIRFTQLFSDNFLTKGRLEIDEDGKIAIHSSDPEFWKSMILELNTVVNLVAYLLNNQLIYAYSNAVILPQQSASLGNYQAVGQTFLSYPYNRKRLARITIRHQSNLFEPYQPLRTLSEDKFVLKADKMHRQIYRATLAAILVALLTSIAGIYDNDSKSKELDELRQQLVKMTDRLLIVEKSLIQTRDIKTLEHSKDSKAVKKTD